MISPTIFRRNWHSFIKEMAGAAAIAAALGATLWIGIAHGAEPGARQRPASADGIVVVAQPYTATNHTIYLPQVFGPPPQPPPLLINNGDFESGRVGWSVYATLGQGLIYSQAELAAPAHGGAWAARLGAGDDEISMLSQGVRIPADHACLVYWQWTVSNDACHADYGGIGVNGNWLDVFSLCSGTATAGWVRRQISMTDYVTGSVVINVAVVNDYSSPSTLYVDDISLQPTGQCAAIVAQAYVDRTAVGRAVEMMKGRPITRSTLAR